MKLTSHLSDKNTLEASKENLAADAEAGWNTRPASRIRNRWLWAGVAAVCLASVAFGIVLCFQLFWQMSHPGMTHFQRGMELAAAGQPGEAEREWQQGIQQDPNFPGCYEKLGDLYLANHNYPAASLKYAAAARLSPNSGTLFLRLTRSQQGEKNLSAAAVSAIRAVELLPGDVEVNTLAGTLARQTGNLPLAIAAYRRAYGLRPGDAALLHELARLELDTRDRAGAETDLAPWLRDRPTDAEACYLMASVCLQKSRDADNLRIGADFARRAAAGMPGNTDAALLLGQYLLFQDRPDDALHTLLPLAASQQNNQTLLDALVQCYTKLGKHDLAEKTAVQLKKVTLRHDRIHYLKAALNTQPANLEAGLELAKLEEKDGDRRAAHSDYVRILRLVPDDPRPHQALAEFYRRTGRPDQAAKVEDMNYTEDITGVDGVGGTGADMTGGTKESGREAASELR